MLPDSSIDIEQATLMSAESSIQAREAQVVRYILEDETF
jgi:hypothetical protein